MKLKLFALLLCILCLASCTLPLEMRLIAHEELNLDYSKISLPVHIKIYLLKDDQPFQEATFRKLWKNDYETLGASLLEKKEITINPGQSTILKFNNKDEANYIGVMGVFRLVNPTNWKSIKPLPSPLRAYLNRVVIYIKDNDVEISNV